MGTYCCNTRNKSVCKSAQVTCTCISKRHNTCTVASLFIIWQLYKHPTQKLFCFALASVMGGAIGNVVDRLMHGYVVDFLDFHAMGWHFPAFNVADSAITVGAVCLIVDELLRARREA